jgi:hypothetical protein
MSADYVSPEKLASLIHHYREALAPDFGLTSSASIEWTELTPQEQSRMIAATRLALLDLSSAMLPESFGTPLGFPELPEGSDGKECGC